MQITSILSPETIRVGVAATDKESVINQAVDLLRGSDKVADLETVRRVVLEREREMSTGVGKGLGLPHGKTSSMKGSASSLIVTSDGIDFDAFDDEPVRIVFLLVGPPESQSVHIRTLSRISRLMNDPENREAVLEADSAEAAYEVIDRAEKDLLR